MALAPPGRCIGVPGGKSKILEERCAVRGLAVRGVHTRALRRYASFYFAIKVARGNEVDARPCVGAGYCVDRVVSG